MSVKQIAKVWELNVPHNYKLVLLALADHADDEGRNIYPSVRRIAWKTNYSPRQVQRTLSQLRARKALIIERVGGGIGGTTMYRLNLKALPRSSVFKLSPPDKMSPPHDIAIAPPPDIAMSPKPSLTVSETKALRPLVLPKVQEQRTKDIETRRRELAEQARVLGVTG